MPVSPTYPGVYVQELPSGNRTIVGVATSITAFVGRALRGPVDDPIRVASFADYERRFGGLSLDSTMSYAVQQYFLSGGRDAIIVRVVKEGASASVDLDVATPLTVTASSVGTGGNSITVAVAHTSESDEFDLTIVNGASTTVYHVTFDSADATKIWVGDLPNQIATAAGVEISSLPAARPSVTAATALSGGTTSAQASLAVAAALSGAATLTLTAADKGSWANQLRVTVDHNTADPTDLATFNLKIEELDEDDTLVRVELFRNVSLDLASARYLTTVLSEESKLLTVTTEPAEGAYGYPRPRNTYSREALAEGSDGAEITATEIEGNEAAKTGIYALEDTDIFNLLCVPPLTASEDVSSDTWARVIEYAESRRAVAIVDAPSEWDDVDGAESGVVSDFSASEYAAIYFPRLKIADPLREHRLTSFAPCGVVAGVIAKTDAQRGLWKAPAGLDARAGIVRGTSVKLTDSDSGRLNPLGLNCLRTFPSAGTVLWGARTLAGADRLASDWKYLPVRRTALFIEESLYRGLQWAVFEPNDEPLWSQVRLAAGSFMHQLFRQGAFQGASPKEAYLVRCDAETTTQADIDRGIVNVIVGFAPLKPAEFVIISIQQIAGQASA